MKMKQLTFMIYLILSCMTISCNYSKKEEEINKSDSLFKKNSGTVKIKTEEEIFEDKLKNEPKIFLKYWSKMSYSDYWEVSKILEQEGLVRISGSDFFYNLGEIELRIEPFYKDNYDSSTDINQNNIIGVTLTRFEKDSYEIFKRKYNLPNYEESFRYNFFIEDNPLYKNKSKDERQLGKNSKNINYEEVKIFTGGEHLSDIYGFSDIKEILIPKDLVIKKDNTVIFIENQKPLGYFPIGGHSNSARFLYKKDDKISSEKRIVSYMEGEYLKVIYAPKSYYDTIEDNNKNYEKQNKIEVENEKKLKKRRKIEISNEI